MDFTLPQENWRWHCFIGTARIPTRSTAAFHDDFDWAANANKQHW
jgi:hypothetical protein